MYVFYFQHIYKLRQTKIIQTFKNIKQYVGGYQGSLAGLSSWSPKKITITFAVPSRLRVTDQNFQTECLHRLSTVSAILYNHEIE